MKKILFLLFILVMPILSFANYRFQDNGKCDLKAFQNGKWQAGDAGVFKGLSFAILYKPGVLKPYAKINSEWYSANADCFIVTQNSKKIVSQKILSQNQYSAGLLYFNQNFTTSGSNKFDYALIGTFFGADLGWRRSFKNISGFDFGAGAELFAGLISVKEDTGSNPKPIFTYAANNYMLFGFKIFPVISKKFGINFKLSLEPGLGMNMVSLPAPSPGLVTFSAPASSSLYFFSQVLASYALKSNLGIQFGLGLTDSFKNLTSQLGLNFRL